VLAEHFGHRALAGLSIPAVTDWLADPFARGSWSVVPPGRFAIREALKPPVGQRLWFAGEALSRAQWGTVGGAWEEGERAADEVAAALGHGGFAERVQVIS
jgi:monoamine oxidase